MGRRRGRGARRDRGVPDRRAPARPSPTGCWRRCCSPTSSARPSAPPSSATARWRDLLRGPSRDRARRAGAIRAVARWTPPATASSRRSTARRAPSAARSPSSTRCAPLGLRDPCRRCTPARCELVERRHRRHRRAHRRPRRVPWRAPARCSSRARCKDLVVGSGIAFEDRGTARAQGRAGRLAALRGAARLTPHVRRASRPPRSATATPRPCRTR